MRIPCGPTRSRRLGAGSRDPYDRAVRRPNSVLFVFLCLSMLVSCQAAAPPSVPGISDANGSPPAASDGDSAAPAPASGDGAGGPPGPGEADIAFDYGPGTFDFPTAAAGLSDLSGYRATLSQSFTGTEAGQPRSWSNTYVMTTTREPAARDLTFTPSGDTADAGALHRAEVGGVAYERLGEEACTAGTIDDTDALAAWEPATFLMGLTAAVPVGSETVNGVPALRYTFDERAFGSLPPADSTGEVWVAVDGGYIVRYLMSTVGSAEYFGEGSEGTLTWDYQLTDANRAPAVEIPPTCTAGLLDAPLLPDAAEVVRVADLVSYVTAAAAADVAAFYQQELPAMGWQPATAEANVTDEATVQDFTRGGERVALVVMTAEGRTTVRLVLGSVSPE